MKLVRTALTITFDSATKPWLEMREIIRAASGDTKQEIQTPPLILDRADQKKRIVIQVKSISHSDELHTSLADAQKEAVNFMVGINNASAFPNMTKMRFEAIFVEPVAMPFHELLASLKERFLLPTRLSNVSSDIALIFDQAEETVLKNIRIGPMDKQQLQSGQILRWPEKSLPDTCIFLGLYYELTEAMPFSQTVLESFLENATSWQITEAESLVSELKGA